MYIFLKYIYLYLYICIQLVIVGDTGDPGAPAQNPHRYFPENYFEKFTVNVPNLTQPNVINLTQFNTHYIS